MVARTTSKGQNNRWRNRLIAKVESGVTGVEKRPGDLRHTLYLVTVAPFQAWRGSPVKRCIGPSPNAFNFALLARRSKHDYSQDGKMFYRLEPSKRQTSNTRLTSISHKKAISADAFYLTAS